MGVCVLLFLWRVLTHDIYISIYRYQKRFILGVCVYMYVYICVCVCTAFHTDLNTLRTGRGSYIFIFTAVPCISSKIFKPRL